MPEAHSSRAHARLAPSAAHRWWECPLSPALEAQFPNITSSFAAEGTAAHELAGWCLANDEQPEDHLGGWIDIKAEHGSPFVEIDPTEIDEENRFFEITDDMVDAVTTYTDYVRLLIAGHADAEFEVEQELDMTHLHPEIFGTGDITIYLPSEAHLHVVDYKHGKGHVVEVENNPQLFLYGAGAAMRYHNRPLERVTLHVVQPRAPHKDGRVRSFAVDLFDLFEFENDIKFAAQRIGVAEKDYVKWGLSDFVVRTWLKAGGHCGFCRALAVCPAARDRSLNAAMAEFGAIGEGIKMPEPSMLTPAQMSALLAEADDIMKFVKAVQELAHSEACAGRVPPGMKLVAKRAIRKWRDEETARTLLESAGMKAADLYEDPKFKSPAKVETLMKKKRFAEWLSDLDMMGEESPIIQKSSGTNLVDENDPRPAVKADAASEFGAAE